MKCKHHAWLNAFKLAASVTPHIKPGKGPMLLIYADGDSKWRRDQNKIFSEAMRSAGNNDIRVVKIPKRDHTSLMTQMNTSDDQIGGLVLSFIKEWKENVLQD